MKTIKIGKGLDDISFGMTRDEVLELVGSPDDKDTYAYEEEDGEIQTETWHYDSVGFSLAFDEDDDWTLGTISVSSDRFELNGYPLIGKSREKVEEFIDEHELGDWEEEDYSSEDMPNHVVLAVLESNVNFWLEDGKLKEIQWGPK